jgi:hypothetical protein
MVLFILSRLFGSFWSFCPGGLVSSFRCYFGPLVSLLGWCVVSLLLARVWFNFKPKYDKCDGPEWTQLNKLGCKIKSWLSLHPLAHLASVKDRYPQTISAFRCRVALCYCPEKLIGNLKGPAKFKPLILPMPDFSLFELRVHFNLDNSEWFLAISFIILLCNRHT